QGRLTVGNIASDDYTAVIQALTNDNDTQVIARPYITVRDGQEAVFSSARDEPFTVVTVDGNTDTTLQDVRFLNVGTTLTVSPNIHPNDLVTLDVALELSDLVEIRNAIPVVDRSTAQSSITVADNGTLILGGLRQSSRSLSRRGVPGLSKVPVLGGLFRNKHRDDSEFEVLLILRPRIVHEPTQTPADPDTIHHDLKLDLKRNLQEHRSEDRHTDDNDEAPLVPPISGDTHSRNYKPRAK
ncbi:MAG: type II and III secretion system protein, partial [Candidatus Hydrogenedentota bacterium]